MTNQNSKRKNIDHRVHRGIVMLKKEKNTENTEKKINKNSVLSVVKKIWGLREVDSVCFYSFCFLIFDILFSETSLIPTYFNTSSSGTVTESGSV